MLPCNSLMIGNLFTNFNNYYGEELLKHINKTIYSSHVINGKNQLAVRFPTFWDCVLRKFYINVATKPLGYICIDKKCHS